MGTSLGAVVGTLPHMGSSLGSPAGPPVECNPYLIYGYVNFTTDLGVRTPAVGANIWVNSTTITNGSGTLSWFAHAQPATLNGNPAASYQFDLPSTTVSGCDNGDSLTLFSYRAGEYNASASNSTTVVVGNPGSHMDVLLKTPALTAFTISANPASGESPVTTVLTNTKVTGGSGGYLSTWMFNDGSNSPADRSNGTWTHTYSHPSVRWYNVTLYVNDSVGDSVQASTVVKLVPDPTISSFTAYPLVLNNSREAHFTTTIVNGASPYSDVYTLGINQATVTHAGAGLVDTLGYWYRGEITNQFATTGTQANVSITDNEGKTAGPSSVTLWVYNISAHASSGGVTSLSAADVGQSVTFTGTAAGGSGTYSYSWRFGDGVAAPVTTLVAAHTFSATGTYTVNFTVNDTTHAGNSVSTTYVITINPALAPVLTTNRTANTVDLGQKITLSGNTSSGGTHPYTTYDFTFGDTTSSSGSAAYVSHTYGATGTYNGQLALTDSAGNTVSSSVVVITVDKDPVPSLVVENKTTLVATVEGYAGETLDFVGSVGAGTGTAPFSYDFVWGDGTPASGFQASATGTHAYTAPGTYPATLTVTDAAGGYATTAPYSVTIYAAMTAVTLTSNLTHAGGELNLAVTFNSQVTGGAGVPWYHFNFSFGDGSAIVFVNQASSILPAQLHTYTRVELVQVNVTVSDNQGEREYATLTINVVPGLTVTIGATPPSATLDPPVNVTFSATTGGGSGSIASYAWNLGGGNTSTVASPTQTYWSSGTYTVTVVVTDSYGDKDGGTYVFTVAGTSTFEPLSAGWNLIAMPGIDQNYDLWFLWEDLVLRGASTATTVVAIQNTAGGLPLNYTFQDGAAGSAAAANQLVGNARGIWVYVAAAQAIGLSATSTAGPLGSPTTLQAGWNNLGWDLSAGTTASALAALIPGATQVTMWDAATQEYTTYVVGFSNPSYDFTISTGQGVLVYVPAATSFTE